MLFSPRAAVSLLLAGASALPTEKHFAKQDGFTVHQVERTRSHVRLGPVAHQRTLLKYGVAVPDFLHIAAENALSSVQVKATGNAGGEQGSATTTPQQNDIAYLTPVTIGDKTLNLNFDTGSSDLWVFSSLLPSSESSGHDVFDPSSATQLQGQSWSVSYGDGSGASGLVYQADVAVGEVTATLQAVEAASYVSAQFQQDIDSDGLLGLAFSSINQVTPNQQTTFFDNVKGGLASPLFTARLRQGAPGAYDFGFLNDSAHTGDITYTGVDNSQGFWGFTASGYAVGTGSVQPSSISAIADTGSTLMYLPAAAVDSYYSAVLGASLDTAQGGYTFPCSATLPSLSVVIGGTTFTVPGSYINYAPVDVTGTMCFGGLQDGTGLPANIFGDIFLKAHYVVFDSSGPRLGFATQTGVDATPSGSPGGGVSNSDPSDDPLGDLLRSIFGSF